MFCLENNSANSVHNQQNEKSTQVKSPNMSPKQGIHVAIDVKEQIWLSTVEYL